MEISAKVLKFKTLKKKDKISWKSVARSLINLFYSLDNYFCRVVIHIIFIWNLVRPTV